MKRCNYRKPPSARELKLPKWAQEAMQQLRADNERLQARLAEMGDTNEAPSILVDDYPHQGGLALPRDSRLELFPDLDNRHVSVEVRFTEFGDVSVRTSLGQMLVLPQSGNSILIRTGER